MVEKSRRHSCPLPYNYCFTGTQGYNTHKIRPFLFRVKASELPLLYGLNKNIFLTSRNTILGMSSMWNANGLKQTI